MAKKSKKPAPRANSAARPAPKAAPSPKRAPAGMLPGVTGEADLHAALALAAETVKRTPAMSDLAWRHQVACAAARSLLDQPGKESLAVRLTRLALPDLADNAALAHIRLVGLWRSGDREATLAEADRVLALRGGQKEGRHAIRNWLRMLNLERPLEPRLVHLADIWDDPAAAAADALAAIPTDGPFPLAEAVLPAIAEISGRPAESLTKGLAWGCEAHRRAVFARRLARGITAAAGTTRTQEQAIALKIDQSIQSRLLPPYLAPALECIAQGQSAMVLQVHAGMSNAIASGFSAPGVGLSLVVAQPGGAGGPGGHVALAGPAAQEQAANLSRMMVEKPRLVRAFADVQTQDSVTAPIGDWTVSFARQVIEIAAQGGAATFFSRTVWTGKAFASTLQAGPSTRNYASTDAFRAALVGFLAAEVRRILDGAPEDMAPDGGFWASLRKA